MNNQSFQNSLKCIAALLFCLQTHNSLADELEVPLTAEEKQFQKEVQECVSILEGTGIVENNDRLVERYCETKIMAKRRGNLGRFARRALAEKATELNPFVITPHESSYILPFTYTDNFHQEAYHFSSPNNPNEGNELADNMNNVEAKYQVSFKVPLRSHSLFTQGDSLYFAMTIQAWWQVYSGEISRPFRETNYKPEIMYISPLPWSLGDGNFGYMVTFEHQSNGQIQGLSRSWNRIHVGLIYDTDNYSLAFKPWYRLKEDKKTSEFDPNGDDNPDIEDYLGHSDMMFAYAFNDDHKLSGKIRKNWKTGNGSIELGYTFPFPFSSRLRGYAQYFSGYGESLIDYNHKQQKIGIGIALTDVF